MTQIRLLKLRQVFAISRKSKSSSYDANKKNEFRAPVKLSNCSYKWIQSEISAWAEEIHYLPGSCFPAGPCEAASYRTFAPSPSLCAKKKTYGISERTTDASRRQTLTVF
jgi:predicted DNA-binding transcriptional regulator AlpA